MLDLETTGSTPLKDRITEIRLIRFENGIEVATSLEDTLDTNEDSNIIGLTT